MQSISNEVKEWIDLINGDFMKFKITLVIECESIAQDTNDNKYIAEIVGDTAMEGAKRNLDPARNAKGISCNIEFTDNVKVKVR